MIPKTQAERAKAYRDRKRFACTQHSEDPVAFCCFALEQIAECLTVGTVPRADMARAMARNALDVLKRYARDAHDAERAVTLRAVTQGPVTNGGEGGALASLSSLLGNSKTSRGLAEETRAVEARDRTGAVTDAPLTRERTRSARRAESPRHVVTAKRNPEILK